MKQKIILDCDPGHDDALAILFAACHPALDLRAITTVAGNQSVEKTTLNALKICSLANISHVPIARGMDRPLLRAPRYASDIHGETGLGGPQLPEPSLTPLPTHAVDLLIDLFLRSEGDITLVATGPLTNVATAIRREPTIVSKIQAIVLMGGAVGLGNITPSAEFNIFADPDAAAIVFDCGRPLTMVPLEVTHRALATEDIMQRLRLSGRRVADAVADLLAFFGESYRRIFGFPAPPVHDPCAIAAVIDPQIIRAAPMYVSIEQISEQCLGRTICDVYGQLRKPANALVGYDLDVPRFWELLLDVLLAYA